MSRVPRHIFVPEEVRDAAYDDRALPIGCGQTISQPFIVALMTEQARVFPGARVLEIGTGSGYQAAVLSELGAQVFSTEIVPELSETAGIVLEELGYVSVSLRQADGWEGWPEQAPFDAIIVTASSPRVPEALLSQLVDGGRLVVPIESDAAWREELCVIERQGSNFITKEVGAVRFVPLTGKARNRP